MTANLHFPLTRTVHAYSTQDMYFVGRRAQHRTADENHGHKDE